MITSQFISKQSKQCSKCKKVKPLTEFYKCRNKDNRYYKQCKACVDSNHLAKWRTKKPNVIISELLRDI